MKPKRKLDLLSECNEQRLMTAEEFGATFCVRCRNGNCGRAGYAETKWSARMETQVERLFETVRRADLRDSRYEGLKASNFLDIAPVAGEPSRISSEDPWARGSNAPPPEPVDSPEEPPPVPETGIPEPPLAPPPVSASPVRPAPPASFGNTPFPEEGAMIDGGPIPEPFRPPTPAPRPAPKTAPIDPWSPAGPKVVPLGARVKMGR